MRQPIIPYVIILFTALALLFLEPVYILISGSRWMEVIYSNLNPSVFSDVCVLVIMIVLCFLSSMNGAVSKRTAINSLVFTVPLTTLMLGCRIIHSCEYTPFCLIPFFKYADVVIVALGVNLIETICHISQERGNSLKASIPSDSNILFDDIATEDLLGRQSMVENYAGIIINNTNENGAFGVAVTGGWGTGKSWFMNALKEELDKHNLTTFTFKPWLYTDSELTINFCKSLKSVLDKRGDTTTNLQAYIEDLLKKSGSIGSMASFILGFRAKLSREELICSAKEELGKSSKRIFVFMDECDRLGKHELLQVFSLIRNTCDFPNLCFVLAYDNQKIGQVLKCAGGLAYAAKMINLSILLENISNDIIVDSLSNMFEKLLGEKDIKKKIGSLDFTEYLPTLRECKRFWNQIYSDYQSQKALFDNICFEIGDWIVLELIKFKDYALYDKLKFAPSELLDTSNEGWNAPAWIYEEKTENVGCKSLLHFLFCKKDKLGYSDYVLGIANQCWFPLYFSDMLPQGYRDNNEYIDSVKDGGFASNMEEWAKQKDKGLIYIVAYLYSNIGHIKTIEALTCYIWGTCDTQSVNHNMVYMMSGYYKDESKHAYRFACNFVAEQPLLLEIFFQVCDVGFYDDSKEEISFEKFMETTSHPLELMALMMGKLKTETYIDDGCYMVLDYCIPMLWKRILSEDKETDGDTLNILEILHDSTFEDTFSRFVFPLVTKSPQRWLGATLKIEVKHKKQCHILLKTREMHAIFGKLDKAQEFINRIKSAVSDENKPFVEEYDTLFNHHKIIVDQINKQKEAERTTISASLLETDKFPLLSKTKSPGVYFSMPLGPALMQIAESSFWKNQNLRIHRKPLGAYFAEEI